VLIFVLFVLTYLLLHRKLKYGKYSQKKVDKFDDVLAERVRTRVNDLRDIVYKVTEGRQREKEFYLSVIKKENYVNDDYEDNFLETYTVDFGFGFNENFIISVVLENRFLDIIDNCIQNNNVNLIMIKNTIKVIEFGIRIRAHQFYDYESYIVELFDKELIRNYDVERAERIISQLSILQLKLEKAEPLLKLVKK
jgi:hypothetical protein